MDRGNIFSGNAFKATLYGTFAFLIVLILTGFLAHNYVTKSLLGDLRFDIETTVVIFTEDYNAEGRDALMEDINAISAEFERTHRLVALFDQNGWRLAGNRTIHPDFEGWAIQEIPAGSDSDGIHRHYLSTSRLGETTLVVGRDLRFVESVQRALIRSLFGIGALMSLVLITIGYQMSRRLQAKLEVMEETLERVSQGETAARLPVSSLNDQADRVSRTMNLHLSQLSDLMVTTKASAAAIAHDLKRPLARAYLSLGTTIDQIDANEKMRAPLEQAQTELGNLTAIVETILRIARIDASHGEKLADTVDLTEIVGEMAETFSVVAEESGQTFVPDFDPASKVTIAGDAGMIGQLIANLLQNAINHCPKGASITLSLNKQAGAVNLCISDNGPGIPTAVREQVLRPFFRAEQSRTTEGNGLGLSLVKSIADRHNASLTLSDNAPGLSVRVTFPR